MNDACVKENFTAANASSPMTTRFACPSRDDLRSRDYRRSNDQQDRPDWNFSNDSVLFEGGIVSFPPGPGLVPSSKESNSSELLTLITLSTFFRPVTLPPTVTFAPVITVEGGGEGIFVVAVVLRPVVTLADEAGSNGGALVSG